MSMQIARMPNINILSTVISYFFFGSACARAAIDFLAPQVLIADILVCRMRPTGSRGHSAPFMPFRGPSLQGKIRMSDVYTILLAIEVTVWICNSHVAVAVVLLLLFPFSIVIVAIAIVDHSSIAVADHQCWVNGSHSRRFSRQLYALMPFECTLCIHSCILAHFINQFILFPLLRLLPCYLLLLHC